MSNFVEKLIKIFTMRYKQYRKILKLIAKF